MRNIKVIVFDLEGTLFSSRELLEKHISLTIELLAKRKKISKEEALNILNLKREELTKELGYKPPLVTVIESLGISRQEFFKEITKVNPFDYLKPAYNVRSMLKSLKNKSFILVLLTNISREYTEKILEALMIDKNLFKYIITSSDVVHIKPNIEPFLLLLKKVSLCPRQILVVGDRDIDLIPAKKLGMKTMLVRKTFASTSIFADIMLDDICDLIKYF
jgi:putative hydrolase of the HAD superfamily